MICRLCLSSLCAETAVRLFETNETMKSNLVTMIGKYLDVELTYDDNYSTSICQECCDHLEDFHQFRLLVEQKQSTLCNEFLEVECDVKWFKKEGSIEIDEANDESLMDLKNVPLFTGDDMNELNEVDAVEEFASAEKEDDKDCLNDDDTPKLKTITDEVIASYMKLNCDLCDDFYADKFTELTTHFKQKHRKRQAYVKCCNNVYSSAWKLEQHIRWHQNPDAFKCTICNKPLRGPYNLKIHIEQVHGEKTKQMEKKRKSFPCTLCKRYFVHQDSLELHLITHEKSKDQETKCKICGKSFSNINSVRTHIKKIHENVHSHVCDVCGKKFKFKPSFERHLLGHQGIVGPTMQCKICGKWSKNEHSLRLHQFTHDNINTTCDHCGKKCVSRTALLRHKRYAHMSQQNLKCKYCEKTFKESRNLTEHEATHTGVQLYSCIHCCKEFRSRSNMYVHVKRQHHDEWVKAKIASSHDPRYKEAVN